MHQAVSKRSQNGRFCAKKITLEAREAPNGLQTSNKWWYSMEYMQEDYPGRKTCRKNAPNGVKTVPKWLILGQNARRTQVGQMMVLNGIHAGGHKQKSAIGNCWGIQCINTLCLFLTFRLFLILVMHIFLSMHLCMRGEKMANMKSA